MDSGLGVVLANRYQIAVLLFHANAARKGSIQLALRPLHGNNNEAAISNVERISRPGCRVYVRRTEIPRVLGGLGINILTTPRGVMTGRQARKQGVGGEVLCQIW